MKSILMHKKANFTQWYSHTLIVMLTTLFILLPSANSNELMQGTMSGKMFFFLYAVLVCGILVSLKFVVSTPACISFSLIDAALLLWIGYILVNGWYQQISLSNRLLELLGLILLYILLRQIEPSKYGIILIAMVLGGIVQAIYGNLQLWGYLPSHHAQFKLTGSFFNPGPFAGYLISVFPVILGVSLFKKKLILFGGERINQTVVWTGGFFILLALVASGSRAAYLAIALSSVILLIKRYSIGQWFKTCTPTKRGFILASIVLGTGIALFGMAKIKSDSVNGRLLIWNVSSNIVREHPLTGVGFDRFRAYYMNKQVDFFSEKPDSPKAMVAGDTNYCFNEFLQHTVENGMVGLLLMLGVLACVFGITNKSFDDELWIAKAGIAGIIIFAMFSYPAQILPIKMSLICYLACIGNFAKKQKIWHLQKSKYILKIMLAVFVVWSVIISITILPAYYVAWESWNSSYQFSKAGNYTASLKENKKAWPLLKHNGDFLTHYGKMLFMAGEYEQAVDVLHQATLFYPNIIVYTTLGDNYKALRKIEEAEQAYLRAWYMNPSRFYPQYLLVKLYDESGQNEKAISIAKEVLAKEVKVQSTAICEIQTEMKNILNRNKKWE